MEGDAPKSKRSKRSVQSESSSPNDASKSSSTAENQRNVKRKIAKRTTSSPSPSSSSKKISTADSTPMNFLDLNNHCLLEIMSRMELRQLCTMAETNVRLKELAQQFFATKYRTNVSLSSLIEPTTGKYALTKVRQLLHNFGHMIGSLTIDDNELADRELFPKLLSLVRKYCFQTVDEVVFLNQRGSDIGVHLATSLFGVELMLRGLGEGSYPTRSKIIFKPQQTIHEQTLVRAD